MHATQYCISWPGQDTFDEAEHLRNNPNLTYGNRTYLCTACLSKENGCSLHDAERMIKQPRTVRRLERA